ncbi:MAG: VIT domain-containing protein, partial [Bacteroidota bacterium]
MRPYGHSWWRLLCLGLFVIAMVPFGLRGQQFVPQISFEDGDSSRTLRLSGLFVSVNVIGNRATTTFDLRFRNDLDRDLEGELSFPLAEGRTVSRFAMDLEGKMREGVVVEKNKGRKAYESIVRQAVDPGLLEQTEGNNFKARIYPIPANGNKRVIIDYEEALTYEDGDDIYNLPLDFLEALDTFQLDIQASKRSFTPQIQRHPLENRPFILRNGTYRLQFNAGNYTADTPLRLLLPVDPEVGQVFVEEIDGEKWFYIRGFPQGVTTRKKPPKTVTLFWDLSASRLYDDRDKEIELLNTYFNYLREFQLKVVTFSHTVLNEMDVEVKGGNWSDTRDFILAQPMDGGTDLNCISSEAYPAEEYLLVSNGLSTLGHRLAWTPDAPLHVIHAAPRADGARLRAACEQSHGHYIDLHQNSTRQALQRLQNIPYRFLGAKIKRSRVKETYPSRPIAVQQSFDFAGKFKGNKTKIELRYGEGNNVRQKETFEIRAPSKGQSIPGIRRLWAQQKLADLLRAPEDNETEITALGKSESLVTPYTSLIVLDRVSDYVNYEITPPEELRREYDSLLAIKTKYHDALDAAESRNEQERIEDVLDVREDLREWYFGDDYKPLRSKEEGHLNTPNSPKNSLFRQHGAPSEVPRPDFLRAEDSTRIIRGTVLDGESGEPLIGVNLIIFEKNRGTISDVDGNFRLEVFPSDSLLEVKYVGYESKTLKIA